MMTLKQEHLFAVKLMEHLIVPTFVLDAQGRVIIWNKACERLTNVLAEELLGTKDHWKAFYKNERMCLADLFVYDKMDQLHELYSNFQIDNLSTHGIRAENWCVMPNVGKKMFLSLDCGPIYDDDGQLIAVVETMRDMTQYKLAEIALENIAFTDGLTELSNRRYFDSRLKQTMHVLSQEQESFSILLCGIDHFGTYLSSYGLERAEICLKQVSKAIQSKIFRSSDVVSRFSEHTLGIIVPYSNMQGAMKVAERLCNAVRDLNIGFENSQTAPHVTLSVGVLSLVPTDTLEYNDVIQMADVALYQAKKKGRNQVFCFQNKIAPIANS